MSRPEPTTPVGPPALVVPRRGFLVGAGLAGMAAVLAACGEAMPTTPGTATPAASGPPSGSAPPASSASPATAGAATTTTPTSLSSRPRDNPIVAENARAGTRSWNDARTPGRVEAYLLVPSVAPGGSLGLRASGTATVDVEWYRLGWYGGDGGRLLRVDRAVRVRRHAAPVFDPQTGLVEARWPSVLDTAAPAGLPSGMLLAVLRSSGHVLANVPVVLRPDPSAARRAPVLFVSAAATWQAYNAWHGHDLYTSTSGTIPATNGLRSAIVSFDRPYYLDDGAGYLRRWELQFIRWMEREGRDVEYVTDVDLQLNPGLVDGRRLVVMAGHPEYWSRPMRTRIEAAVAAGINVAFLTGNEVYWQVRLEDGPAGPASRVVCYKRAASDPMMATNPSLTTCRWREAPVNDPEATLVGQMYGHIVARPADWVVAEPRHWLYEGTALVTGDRLVNLVGQEYDTFFPDLAQPGTTILARSPVSVATRSTHDPGATPSGAPAAPPIHTSTVYTAQSGATVLAAGTFQWSWAIDRFGDRSYRGVATPYDERVVRMTRNLFDRLGDGRLAP